MSNLSWTPPNEQRSAEKDHYAAIGNILNALTDDTIQLVLDSEEIATNQMRSLGSFQPVPPVTLTLLNNLLETFQERMMEMIERRLTDESSINLRHGVDVIRNFNYCFKTYIRGFISVVVEGFENSHVELFLFSDSYVSSLSPLVLIKFSIVITCTSGYFGGCPATWLPRGWPAILSW